MSATDAGIARKTRKSAVTPEDEAYFRSWRTVHPVRDEREYLFAGLLPAMLRGGKSENGVEPEKLDADENGRKEEVAEETK